jgi:hypothetical protein
MPHHHRLRSAAALLGLTLAACSPAGPVELSGAFRLDESGTFVALDFGNEHEVQVSLGMSGHPPNFGKVCEYVRTGDQVMITVDDDTGKTMVLNIESNGLRLENGQLMEKDLRSPADRSGAPR